MKRLESKKELDQQDFIELGSGKWDTFIVEGINLQYQLFKNGTDPEEVEYNYKQQQFNVNDLLVAGNEIKQALNNSTNKKTTSGATINKGKKSVELDELEFDKSKVKENNKEVDENGQKINRYSNNINNTSTQEEGNTGCFLQYKNAQKCSRFM